MTTEKLIKAENLTPFKKIEKEKAEMIYKSSKTEVLGRTVDRNIILPSKFTQGFTFRMY